MPINERPIIMFVLVNILIVKTLNFFGDGSLKRVKFNERKYIVKTKKEVSLTYTEPHNCAFFFSGCPSAIKIFFPRVQ